MNKIFLIFKKIHALKLFYFLTFFSLILSIFEYSFIFTIYSLVDYQITNNLHSILENIILFLNINYEIALNKFNFLLLLVVIIFCIKTALYLLYNYIISAFSQNISYKLAKKIFVSSFNNNKDILNHNKNSSYYKNTIIVDVPLFINSVVQPLFFLINDALILSAILIFLFITNTLISMYLIIFISFTCLIFYIYLKNKLIVWGKIREESSSNLIKNLNEVYKGLLEIKIYDVAKFFFYKISNELDNIRESLTKTNFFIHFPRIVLEIIIFFSIFLLIFLSTGNENAISILPYLSAAVAASIKIIPMFSRIMTGIQGYYFAKQVVNKINNLLKINPLKENNYNNEKKLEKINEVKIQNLTFKQKNKVILNKINLNLRKDFIVGITGDSGTGKSTFARILAGLEKGYSGRIKFYKNKKLLLHNNPIIGLTSIIPQDVFVFDDTLDNNIKFNKNKDISNQNEKLLKELTNKIDIDKRRGLGEDGKKISGGQKQRLGVLRSLFFNKEFIIFDESSSNLDLNNKLALFKIVKKIKKDKIILIISHDKKFLNICDKTILLKNGKFITKKM